MKRRMTARSLSYRKRAARSNGTTRRRDWAMERKRGSGVRFEITELLISRSVRKRSSSPVFSPVKKKPSAGAVYISLVGLPGIKGPVNGNIPPLPWFGA